METIHVKFDELTTMAFECNNLEPEINCMNFTNSLKDSQSIPSKSYLDNLFGPLFEEYYSTSSHEVSDDSAANIHNHSMGYRYSKDYGFELIAYADADHAGCNDDCKSTSGGIQFLRDKLVSWSSKSKIVQLCQSADAAYVISRLLCYQVISDANSNYWTKDFYYHKISTYYDSKSALPIMQSVQHSRTKHINIRYHFIKEHVEKVQLNYTLSGRNTSLLIYSQKPFRRKVFHMAQHVLPAAQLVPQYKSIGRCNNYASCTSCTADVPVILIPYNDLAGRQRSTYFIASSCTQPKHADSAALLGGDFMNMNYHSIKDGIPLVSVYTTRNVSVREMLIPDAFLTAEIRETNDFKEYGDGVH
ncbi:hypothetical protein Tco_0772020 [Tanacetum coccineum]|uniref:Uncharacterized protein n=1 Tax=Tanacetum coccineum TaxID=301880 RepID=A0ABQ4ZGQ5_9ASTR